MCIASMCSTSNQSDCGGCMSCQYNCETCQGCQGCQSTCERSYQCGTCQDYCQSACEKGCQSSCETSTQAPRTPGNISISPVAPYKSGQEVTVQWSGVSDPYGGTITYTVYGKIQEKIINFGSTTATSKKISIPQVGLRDAIQFRVMASSNRGGSSQTGYTNFFDIINNQPPIISGSDMDLGGKVDDFTVDYIITDQDDNDEVLVTVQLDNTTLQQAKKTTLGVKNTIHVAVKDLDLGNHTLTITVKDKQGAISTRTYRFSKVNAVPKILDERDQEYGSEVDLREKNTAFSVAFKVLDPNHDAVMVTASLNGKVVKQIQNADQGKLIQVTIDQDTINGLKINEQNIITIRADDGRGGVNNVRIRFVRTNMAPIISGTNTNLGDLIDKLTYTYSATDVDGDAISGQAFLDSVPLTGLEQLKDGEQKTVTIDGKQWFRVAPGQHKLKIKAEDDKGGRSERQVTFTRKVDKCGIEMAEPISTDAQANSIVVIIQWNLANGAVGKVEACNNAYDTNPTWEDITDFAINSRKYDFKNKTKTASKWGVNVRATVTRDQAKDFSYIFGFGGSIE